MASKLAPDMKETLAKYAQDAGIAANLILGPAPETLESQVRAYAKGMGTANYDVAAWLWVKEQNKTPPPMKVSSAPFAILEKPYLNLAEAQIKTLGEQTGFNVRGYVLSKRNFTVHSSGKPGCAVMITDTTDIRDILYFGDQVEKLDALLPQGFPKGQAILVKNVQCKYSQKDPTKWGLSVSGYYSDTSKIGDTDMDLPGKSAVSSMRATKFAKDLKQQETAMIKVRAISFENKPYVGCPSCKKKITENIPAGRSTICPSDKSSCAGTQITAITVDRFRVTAFDDSGEVKLSFGFGESFIPSAQIQDLANTKAQLMAAGSLNDSGEFDVSFVMPAVVGAAPVTNVTTTSIPTIVSNPPQPMTVTIGGGTTVTSVPGTFTNVPPTVPKAPTITPIEAALRSLRVIGPLGKDEFITGFLVGKKGMNLDDAQQVVIEMLDAGKAVLNEKNELRIA